jgi:hypothetical protein
MTADPCTLKKIEHEMHQIDPKNAGSQNFSFLALEGEAEGAAQN